MGLEEDSLPLPFGGLVFSKNYEFLIFLVVFLGGVSKFV